MSLGSANGDYVKGGMGGKTSNSERRELTATLKKTGKKRRRKSIEREVAESLGLVAVRGAVSGRIYYE